MGRSIRLVVVALVTALTVAACGGKHEAPPEAATPSASAPQVVDDGTLAAGEKVSAPKGEVVLTVTGDIGDIGTANKGRRLGLDLAGLEQMRRVRLEAAEPFLKRRVMFEGVLLSDLLAVAGVPDSASKVSLTALDDYEVEFKAPTPRRRPRSPSASSTPCISRSASTAGRSRSRPASAWPPAGRGPTRRTSCSATPTATSSSCTTSRSSSWPRAASPGWRRWSAGTTRPGACRRRQRSSPWPRSEPGRRGGARAGDLQAVAAPPHPRDTESVLVSDVEAMSARLRELKGLGVLLAIDDFGTGYSSLSYPRRFPIDMLKIDKAFVDGIGRGRGETALAHAIVNLSHTLQLHTVAEGIEQAEQAGHLASLGRRDGQGYLFARPLDVEAMTELLAASLADGGLYLPAARPVGSLSEVG